MSCVLQAVRFHQWPSEQKKSTGEEEAADKKEEKKGPRPTDWRWGPAQYWYDMLNLPEAPEDYDYGLKYALEHMNDDLKVKSENGGGGSPKSRVDPSPKSESSEISFPDDAFLMVTQGGNLIEMDYFQIYSMSILSVQSCLITSTLTRDQNFY